VQAHPAHQFIQQERGPRHISTVLEQRNKEKQQQYLR
jgi:hypothetical protein